MGGISVWDITKEPLYLVDNINQGYNANVCEVPDPSLNIPANCAIVLSLSEMNNKGY